jgi:predicted 2-oxoglutarate/Fe(II)-dependent dioxygenase YbiX
LCAYSEAAVAEASETTAGAETSEAGAATTSEAGATVSEAAGAETSEAVEAAGAASSLLQAAKNKDIRAAAANKDFFMIMYLNLYQKVLL